jgi:2C-methyl-D-erythritol 2,4-cyclodiphosphate synthase
MIDVFIISKKGMKRMDTQRIVLETEEKEFIETVISFVTEKGWTISNLQNAVSKVEDYMKKNATLTELTIGMPAQIKD